MHFSTAIIQLVTKKGKPLPTSYLSFYYYDPCSSLSKVFVSFLKRNIWKPLNSSNLNFDYQYHIPSLIAAVVYDHRSTFKTIFNRGVPLSFVLSRLVFYFILMLSLLLHLPTPMTTILLCNTPFIYIKKE